MKKRDNLLLMLGLIFSSIIRLRFSLNDGFQYDSLWVSLPITFFSYSTTFTSSLTTTFIGYLLFTLFGIFLYLETPKGTPRYRILTIYILASAASAGYEISQIISDYNGHFNFRHLHLGPSLFLFGLITLTKDQKKAGY